MFQKYDRNTYNLMHRRKIKVTKLYKNIHVYKLYKQNMFVKFVDGFLTTKVLLEVDKQILKHRTKTI